MHRDTVRAVSRTAALVIGTALCAGIAHADPDLAPPADVPSTERGAPTMVLHLDYEYERDRSTISRENIGPGADPLGATPKTKEMTFHQDQHTITPRADLAIYHDTWLTFSLPIVISQTRELDLSSGTDRGSISTVQDGILPANGLNASDPTAGFGANTNELFKGVSRHGLTQLHMGFGIAPMNQRTDDTKPTWRIGAEYLLAVGKVMKLDPASPASETGVSSGVDEVRVWTQVDRKLAHVRPWFEMFWQAPVRARSSSLFQDLGYGSTNVMPGQQAGAHFGVDLTLVDKPEDHDRVSLGLGGRVIGHFEGRGYSELWEVFANAGDANTGGPLVLDKDPTTNGVQPLSHPGIDDIENYLETGLRVALRAELGEHVRLQLVGDVVWKTDHAITMANSGVDLPTCTATHTTHCEVDSNNLVNPGTAEVNPAYVPAIDLVGHRYLSEDNLGVIFGLDAAVTF
jgi:hypothetical protein